MEQDPTWRVFWRILFDVVGTTPRLQLEMTLWEPFMRKRLGRSLKDLTPDMTPQGAVYFTGDRAIFVGGYLECFLDLNSILNDLLLSAGIDPGEPVVASHASVSLNGENVAITADVALFDSSGKTEFPIFHLSQPSSSEGVRLVEDTSDPAQRDILWTISGDFLPTGPQFELEAFDARHRIRVRQEEGSGGLDEFRFLVDSIPLAFRATSRDHEFHGEPQVFLIGATPDHLGGLFGEIHYLEFDPNSSCGSCAG